MDRTLYFKLSTLFFLQFFIWGSWYVTTGTYLLQTVGFSGREVGLVYSSTAIAATVSPFLIGVLADRLFAMEKLLAMLHAGGSVMMLIISFLDKFIVFYPALILYALLYMPTFALSVALAFHHLADGPRDFPKARVWGSVSWILVGLTVSYFGIESTAIPLRMSAAASLAASFFCLTLPHTPPQGKVARRSLRDFLGPEILDLLRNRSFAVLVISEVLVAVPSGFYYSFTNPFLTEIGFPNPAASMTIGQVIELSLMVAMPLFYHRLGFKTVITIGLYSWGVRYLLFSMGDNGSLAWMLWVGMALHGVAFNFTQLSGQIYINTIAPPQARGTAQGFMSMITQGFGALIGAYIAGEVVQQYTLGSGHHLWNMIWLIPAVVGMVATGVFLVGFKRE